MPIHVVFTISEIIEYLKLSNVKNNLNDEKNISNSDL